MTTLTMPQMTSSLLSSIVSALMSPSRLMTTNLKATRLLFVIVTASSMASTQGFDSES